MVLPRFSSRIAPWVRGHTHRMPLFQCDTENGAREARNARFWRYFSFVKLLEVGDPTVKQWPEWFEIVQEIVDTRGIPPAFIQLRPIRMPKRVLQGKRTTRQRRFNEWYRPGGQAFRKAVSML